MTGIKIATFAFNVSSPFHKDNNHLKEVSEGKELQAKKYEPTVTSDGKIDEIICGFCKLSHVAEIVDIKIHNETILQHNNGGYDIVRRVYTIIYKEHND